LHGDVLDQHQFVVALVVREGRQIELPGGEHLGEGAGDSSRRVGQVLGRRVLTQRDQQIGHRLLRR
jgi:hypothetical protein